MADAKILVPEIGGRHNTNFPAATDRLKRAGGYADQSMVCLIPTVTQRSDDKPPQYIHPRVVQSWLTLIRPMNQRFINVFMWDMEVGDAYQTAIEMILANKELSTWKYVLTLEEDNIPPADGILKLIESIEGGVDGQKYDAVGGLYWTKGEGGQPMIYGNPLVTPMNFLPQIPVNEAVQPCNGLGMGFTLFRLSMFKSKKIDKPFFKTLTGQSGGMMTQDLFFFQKGRAAGFRFASDNRVKVGHYDAATDTVW